MAQSLLNSEPNTRSERQALAFSPRCSNARVSMLRLGSILVFPCVPGMGTATGAPERPYAEVVGACTGLLCALLFYAFGIAACRALRSAARVAAKQCLEPSLLLSVLCGSARPTAFFLFWAGGLYQRVSIDPYHADMLPLIRDALRSSGATECTRTASTTPATGRFP